MRIRYVAATVLSLLPFAAVAQDEPPQGGPAGPGVTREQFIQRAQERAARRAAEMFDRMDSDHNGILDPQEHQAWVAGHPRARPLQGGGGSPDGPPSGPPRAGSYPPPPGPPPPGSEDVPPQ